MFNEKKTAKQAIEAMQSALEAGNKESMMNAWEQFQASIVEDVQEGIAAQSTDAAALASRGKRVLTGEEKKFYEALASASKSERPKQALTDLIPKGMPMTIIEDVYREVLDSHPLLNAVNFQNVGYLTRWVVANNKPATAVWGAINGTITQQISEAFTTIEITQNKLSAYAQIEKDMLDLGPAFIDAYVRKFLAESISIGLEKAIITGTGKGEPIGLDCVIGNAVAIGSDGYAKKTPVALNSFAPEAYGAVLKKLAKTELGNPRNFTKAVLVVSQEDYLEKVMPASTVMTANGNYVSNVFPFPTEVIVSDYIPKRYGSDSSDKHYAILFVPGEYDVLVGNGKTGVIEFSDEFAFLDDKRTLKTKLFAAGRAKDANSAIVLDITNMEPAYIRVKNVEVTD